MNSRIASILTGFALIAGVGVATVVYAQSPDRNSKETVSARSIEQDTKQNGGSIEVSTSEESQQWQETRRQFEEAGITLNAKQEAELRQASQQFTAELLRAGMTNSRDLLLLLALPSNQVQAAMP